jgi:hypothetical protein
VAKGAPAFAQFPGEHDFAAGVLGVLAGSLPAEQIREAAQSTAKTLSSTGALQEYFESIGKGDASLEARLSALVQGGVNTPDALVQAGVTEDLAKRSLTILTSAANFAQLQNIQSAVESRNEPGMIMEMFAQTMRDNPSLAAAKQVDIAQAQFKANQLREESAIPASEETRRQVQLGTALQQQGIRQFLGFDLVDQTGAARFGATPLSWLEVLRQEIFKDPSGVESIGQGKFFGLTVLERLNEVDAAYQAQRRQDLSPEGVRTGAAADLTAARGDAAPSGRFEDFFRDLAAAVSDGSLEGTITRGVSRALQQTPEGPPVFNLEGAR